MAELLIQLFFFGGGAKIRPISAYLFLMFDVPIEVGLSDIQLSFLSASVERMWIIKDTGIFELFIFRLL